METQPVLSIDKDIATVTTQTLQLLFATPDYQDALILYFFYIKNSKSQETNNIWAGGEFCMKGLKWGDARFTSAKRVLRELHLIEDVRQRDEKTGKVTKCFVNVKYIWEPTHSGPEVVDEKTTHSENQSLANVGQMLNGEKKYMYGEEKKDLIRIKSKEKIPKPDKPEQSLGFLLSLPDPVVEEFLTAFGLSADQVRKCGYSAYYWCEANGRVKKNYKAFLRNWIERYVESKNAAEKKFKPNHAGPITDY